LGHISLWEGCSVPAVVLQYMNLLLENGLLDFILKEFDHANISGPRGSAMLDAVIKLVVILPTSTLVRAKHGLLHALGAAVSLDDQELRKLHKNVVYRVFQTVVAIDRRLSTLSVNELGHIGVLLLKSTLLDKRMVGSTCLNLLCDHARDVATNECYNSLDGNAVTLRNLLITNGALDLLFGPSMHGEVSKLKRCNHIVRMIFEQHASDSSTIESALLLWSSLFDRHSEMFDACYEAYKHAIQFFSVPVLKHSLNHIFATSHIMLNARPRTLNLLLEILELRRLDVVVKKEFVDSISEYLLNLQLIHCDDPAFSESVVFAKHVLFTHAFDHATASSLVKRICHQCVIALQNPSTRSCNILDFLLEFYSKNCDKSCSSELMIVLCHVLEALCSHCILDSYSISMFSFLSNATVVQLLSLAFEDKLWRALAIDTAEEGRRQQAFEFLLQSKTLNAEVQQYILQTRLSALPSSCMSSKALECLLYLIESVNAPENRIQVGTKRDRADTPDFATISNLIGLDTLWKFCLSCPNSNVLRNAVFKFSSYITESSRTHPGIFQSVAQNCVTELKSVDVGFIKARNIIFAMLDMSRCAGALWKSALSHEQYQPLGHIVQQPQVFVIVSLESSYHSLYFCPLLTIQQFRTEIASQLKIHSSFELLFQVPNADGQPEFVKVDDESQFLVRYGPAITCQIRITLSAGASFRSSTHSNGSSKPEKQLKASRYDSQMQTVPLPLALRQTAIVHSGRSVPEVRVPFDEPLPATHLQIDFDRVIPDSPSLPAGIDRASNFIEAHHEMIHPWSMFIENTGNFQVLFKLGSAFPSLNSHIWDLLLLLPVNVDFISQILQSSSQPRMFFNIKSTLEKIYFLSCVTVWKKLPASCFQQPIDHMDFFSSAAVAALDMPDALQCSISLATSFPDLSLDLEGSFGSLLLSCHLSAIFSVKFETESVPNSNCLS
jgi:hypothetical protein